MALVEKKIFFKLFLVVAFTTLSLLSSAQINSLNPELIKPDPAKEKKYLPYLAVRHGGLPTIETWKSNNTYQYYKELWYYCESFYVKRNNTTDGIELDEGMIDISRFESFRKENEEAIVELPGIKDALVLLPITKLVYKPKWN